MASLYLPLSRRASRLSAVVAALAAALVLAGSATGGTAPLDDEADTAAIAATDAAVHTVIEQESAKFVEELQKWARELAAKGETARTGELTSASTGCSEETPNRPFTALGDTADYTLVPGGSFEAGQPAWTLTNAAHIAADSQPWPVSAPGLAALAIPKGSTVTSPAFCVTEAHPTIRFFARIDGQLRSRLRVEVLYEDIGGSVKVLPIAYLSASRSWQATPIVPLRVHLRAQLAADRTAAVALRLTAEAGEGVWYVDGVFVDPFRGR